MSSFYSFLILIISRSGFFSLFPSFCCPQKMYNRRLYFFFYFFQWLFLPFLIMGSIKYIFLFLYLYPLFELFLSFFFPLSNWHSLIYFICRRPRPFALYAHFPWPKVKSAQPALAHEKKYPPTPSSFQRKIERGRTTWQRKRPEWQVHKSYPKKKHRTKVCVKMWEGER